jgi:hypothetical protein
VEKDNVWVDLGSLKTVTAKVMSWSNMIHRPGENNVKKIHNQKLDYSNVKTKVRGSNRCKDMVSIKPVTQ